MKYKDNINNSNENTVCKGCVYFHIGQNVNHNHCLFPYNRGDFGISYYDSFEDRANGHDKSRCYRKITKSLYNKT